MIVTPSGVLKERLEVEDLVGFSFRLALEQVRLAFSEYIYVLAAKSPSKPKALFLL